MIGLQKLLAWLSPAFPVGAFAWSAGLESAIADRTLSDSTALQNWIAGALAHGAIRTDAILLAEAHRAVCDGPEAPAGGAPAEDDARRIALSARLAELADLCLALTPAVERHAETTSTGNAFALAAAAWPVAILDRLPQPCPYPIAVGAVAAAHGLELSHTLLGFLTATVQAQVSVAVRLVPLGQTDGLRVMAALEPQVAALAVEAADSFARLGAVAYATDIAQMRHETLETRIFRS